MAIFNSYVSLPEGTRNHNFVSVGHPEDPCFILWMIFLHDIFLLTAVYFPVYFIVDSGCCGFNR